MFCNNLSDEHIKFKKKLHVPGFEWYFHWWTALG